jgi:hypothetical protein
MGNVRPSLPIPILLEPPLFWHHLQILFLIGLTIIIGPQKTLLFFARRQKLKGTAAFFGGLFLILMRWPLIGFLVELYGIFVLFGDFLGTIAGFARNIPVIGPYIGMLVDRAGVSTRSSELPVWERGWGWEETKSWPLTAFCVIMFDYEETYGLHNGDLYNDEAVLC